MIDQRSSGLALFDRVLPARQTVEDRQPLIAFAVLNPLIVGGRVAANLIVANNFFEESTELVERDRISDF